MISFLPSLSPIFNYLIITAIFVFIIVIFFSVVFDDVRGKVSSEIKLSFIFTFCINLLFYFLVFYLIKISTGPDIYDNEAMPFFYLMFLSFFTGAIPVMEIKGNLLKTKGRSAVEAYDNVSKKVSSVVREISLLFALLLIPMYFFGNGSMNMLLILFLLSTIISCAGWTVVFPRILKFRQSGKKS